MKSPGVPLFLLAAAALAAPALGQEKSEPPVFSAGTDIVNVTLTVRDGQGHLISDLTREDFAVQEDGRLQAVQVFARAVQPGLD